MTKVSAFERALDAHGAKAYLAAQPFIDSKHIAIMGMSHGGWSLLSAISADATGVFNPFQAAVAMYPACDTSLRFVTPLIILIGEKDDWTQASWCEKAIPNAKSDDEIILKIYPNAHHVFDVEGIDHEELGHTLRYNESVATDAIQQVKKFLEKYLR